MDIYLAESWASLLGPMWADWTVVLMAHLMSVAQLALLKAWCSASLRAHQKVVSWGPSWESMMMGLSMAHCLVKRTGPMKMGTR